MNNEHPGGAVMTEDTKDLIIAFVSSLISAGVAMFIIWSGWV